MKKNQFTHPVYKMSLDEKINIYNLWHETGRDLKELLEERNYFFESYYRTLLVKHVIEAFNDINYKIYMLKREERELFLNKYNAKVESFKDLLIDYLPEKKEFIFRSKV